MKLYEHWTTRTEIYSRKSVCALSAWIYKHVAAHVLYTWFGQANSPVRAFQITLSIQLSYFTYFIPKTAVTVSKSPSKCSQQVKTCICLTEPGLVQAQDVKTADCKPAAMHLAVMQSRAVVREQGWSCLQSSQPCEKTVTGSHRG